MFENEVKKTGRIKKSKKIKTNAIRIAFVSFLLKTVTLYVEHLFLLSVHAIRIAFSFNYEDSHPERAQRVEWV